MNTKCQNQMRYLVDSYIGSLHTHTHAHTHTHTHTHKNKQHRLVHEHQHINCTTDCTDYSTSLNPESTGASKHCTDCSTSVLLWCSWLTEADSMHHVNISSFICRYLADLSVGSGLCYIARQLRYIYCIMYCNNHTLQALSHALTYVKQNTPGMRSMMRTMARYLKLSWCADHQSTLTACFNHHTASTLIRYLCTSISCVHTYIYMYTHTHT
jgi:hypothetical protein